MTQIPRGARRRLRRATVNLARVVLIPLVVSGCLTRDDSNTGATHVESTLWTVPPSSSTPAVEVSGAPDPCGPFKSAITPRADFPRSVTAVQPESVRSGDQLKVLGAGFPPGGEVRLRLGRPGDEPQPIVARAAADTDGKVEFNLTMPLRPDLIRPMEPGGPTLPCVIVVMLSEAGSAAGLLQYAP